jgi:hypothetical protein
MLQLLQVQQQQLTDPVIIVVDTNGGANMAWDVYVMDANGCSLLNHKPLF